MAGGMLLPAGQLPLAGRQGNARRPAFQADDLRSSRSQVSCSAPWVSNKSSNADVGINTLVLQDGTESSCK